MAQRGQLATFFIQNGDFPAYNDGLVDIPANRFVIVNTAFSPTGDQILAVKLPVNGDPIVGTFGITRTTIRTKSTGSVCRLGGEVVKADGAVTVGAWVQASDAVGKEGYAKTKGAGIENGGQAMNTAADGEDVLVFVAPSPVV